MTYILKKMGSGLLVSKPGRNKSYTNRVEHAQRFDTKAEADSDKCGNEVSIELMDYLSVKGII